MSRVVLEKGSSQSKMDVLIAGFSSFRNELIKRNYEEEIKSLGGWSLTLNQSKGMLRYTEGRVDKAKRKKHIAFCQRKANACKNRIEREYSRHKKINLFKTINKYELLNVFGQFYHSFHMVNNNELHLITKPIIMSHLCTSETSHPSGYPKRGYYNIGIIDIILHFCERSCNNIKFRPVDFKELGHPHTYSNKCRGMCWGQMEPPYKIIKEGKIIEFLWNINLYLSTMNCNSCINSVYNVIRFHKRIMDHRGNKCTSRMRTGAKKKASKSVQPSRRDWALR